MEYIQQGMEDLIRIIKKRKIKSIAIRYKKRGADWIFLIKSRYKKQLFYEFEAN